MEYSCDNCYYINIIIKCVKVKGGSIDIKKCYNEIKLIYCWIS